MSLIEAFRGAKVEMSQTTGFVRKFRLCGVYATILGQELLGTMAAIPYGWKALQLHSTLPGPQGSQRSANESHGVFLLKHQRYGKRERNTVDVYLPKAALEKRKEEKCPVAVFCHGGVWSTGSSWHYAPMATRLAQEGIVTCIVQYSLYPHALTPQMVDEVSEALDWTARKAESFGGCQTRISVVGHSAGAHLWMMALLQRAVGGSNQAGRAFSMPASFVGMAGAYDIGKHYEYERERGVAFLSTMARAVGGFAGFAAQSPAVILSHCSAAVPTVDAGEGRTACQQQLELLGEAVAAANPLSSNSFLAASTSSGKVDPFVSQPLQPLEAQNAGCLKLTAEQLRALPPIYLMSSREDITVPWYQSWLMHEALQKCGCRAEHRLYPGTAHADFAIDWEVQPKGDCKVFAQDLTNIIHSAGKE